MIVIVKELLQYDKDYIKYYINIPKIYYKENDNKDYVKNEMIESINQVIFEDITSFMNVVEDSHNISDVEHINVNCITEFQVGYVSKNIMSLAIEFSQLAELYDISYLKAYNYDFKLKKDIDLKDFFKENVDYIKILKKNIMIQAKTLFMEFEGYAEYDLHHVCEDSICLDKENIFYFTREYLILSFSSCEINEDILNLVEFKIPFSKIYHYLSEYAIKNIVKEIMI